MIFYITILPLLFSLIILIRYDTYEIYLNSNSNLITNLIYKISNYWSLIENNLFFLLIGILIYNYINKNNNINTNAYNLIIIFLLFIIKYFSFYLNSNLFYTNSSLFNPLLTHFLVFIHPPIILLLLLLLKNNNFRNRNMKRYFYFFTFTLFLGSYWATSVFGWGGWWSWDPIENISLLYWLLLLFYIHKLTKNNHITYYIIFTVDFYLFFFMKFNNFQSIHLFKIIYINLQNHFIYLYLLLTILACYLLYKKNNIKYKLTVLLYLIKHIMIVIILFTFYFYIHTIINTMFLYYILVYITLIVVVTVIILQKIKKIQYSIILIYIITVSNILSLISFYYIFYISFFYKYIIKKIYSFYTVHMLILLVVYIVYTINNQIEENIITYLYGYKNNKNYCFLNEIDININYIEYYYKWNENNITNLFINNYYNIYNIFEKIEFNIYNAVFENTYFNLKNNIIQIYYIKYIICLFTVVTILIFKRT